MDISKTIAKLLWNQYKKKYPDLTSEELFCIIFDDMAEERGRQMAFHPPFPPKNPIRPSDR